MRIMRITQSHVHNGSTISQIPIPRTPTPSPRSSRPHSPLPTPYSLLLVLLLSCQTTPQTPDPLKIASNNLPLEAGAQTYVLADVKGARPVLDIISLPGMDAKQAALVLDRMDTMAIGLYPESSDRRMQLVAWGNVTPSQGGLVFGLNRDWKKTRCADGHEYWHSQKNGMSVATGMKQAFAIQSSAGRPLDPVTHSSGTELPDGFRNFSRGAVIFCWLEDPAATTKRFFDELGIPFTLPAERIFISMFPAKENAESLPRYTALLRIQTTGEIQARVLVRVISLAQAFAGAPSTAGGISLATILLSNTPVQEGSFVRITSPEMSAADLAGLLLTLMR